MEKGNDAVLREFFDVTSENMLIRIAGVDESLEIILDMYRHPYYEEVNVETK